MEKLFDRFNVRRQWHLFVFIGLLFLPLIIKSDYYLDLTNLEKTDAREVDQLLTKFWQRFIAMDERQQALEKLGLSDPIEYSRIKSRYRRLVMEHHPDRGGDHESLQLVNEAMRTLDKIYGQ